MCENRFECQNSYVDVKSKFVAKRPIRYSDLKSE